MSKVYFSDDEVKKLMIETIKLMFSGIPNYIDIENFLINYFYESNRPLPDNIHDRAIALEMFINNL